MLPRVRHVAGVQQKKLHPTNQKTEDTMQLDIRHVARYGAG